MGHPKKVRGAEISSSCFCLHKSWVFFRSSGHFFLVVEVLGYQVLLIPVNHGFSYPFVLSFLVVLFSQPLFRPHLDSLAKVHQHKLSWEGFSTLRFRTNSPTKTYHVPLFPPAEMSRGKTDQPADGIRDTGFFNGDPHFDKWRFSNNCCLLKNFPVLGVFGPTKTYPPTIWEGLLPPQKGVKRLAKTRSFPTHLKNLCLSKLVHLPPFCWSETCKKKQTQLPQTI